MTTPGTRCECGHSYFVHSPTGSECREAIRATPESITYCDCAGFRPAPSPTGAADTNPILVGPECVRCGRREPWHPDGSCHLFVAREEPGAAAGAMADGLRHVRFGPHHFVRGVNVMSGPETWLRVDEQGGYHYAGAKEWLDRIAELEDEVARLRAAPVADSALREAARDVYDEMGPRDDRGKVVEPSAFAALTGREVDALWDFSHRHMMHNLARALSRVPSSVAASGEKS